REYLKEVFADELRAGGNEVIIQSYKPIVGKPVSRHHGCSICHFRHLGCKCCCEFTLGIGHGLNTIAFRKILHDLVQPIIIDIEMIDIHFVSYIEVDKQCCCQANRQSAEVD